MGHTPRYIPRGALVEVTHRTFKGMMLLKPTPEFNARVEGIIARAQHLFLVRLVAYVFMGNHYHAQMLPDDAEQEARFLQHIDRNIAVAVRELHGWDGPVWAGRPHIAIVADDAQSIRRRRYLMSNSVKEGLVASPLDHPGVNSNRAELEGRDIPAIWSSSAQRRAARKAGRPIDSPGYRDEYTIELTPLPCLQGRSAEQRRQFYQDMIAEVIAEGVKLRNGRRPLGAAVVRCISHLEVRPLVKKGPRRPIVYASHGRTKRRFLHERRSWLSDYRRASTEFRGGALTTPFPLGALRPPGPPVPWARPPPMAQQAPPHI